MSASSAAKATARRAVRAARRARTEAERHDAALAWGRSAHLISEIVPGLRTVGAYLAAEGEPDLTSAISAWHVAGLRVLVPVSRPGRRLDWVEWTQGLRVERGRTAPVPEPVDGVAADPEDLDLVVVPALGVGRDGTRLGQGGGFYDTFLGDHPGLPTVGCVFADEVVDSVASDPWDAVLDAVWTPEDLRTLPL